MDRSTKTLFIIMTIVFGLSCSGKEISVTEEEKSYIIELSVSPSEAGTVRGVGAFKEGELITIIALAETEFAFDYWQVAGSKEVFSYEETYSFLVCQDLSLIAVFKKIEEVLDTDSDVVDIDGNVYTTVKIGSQTWMVENLKVTRYSNGDPIERVNDDIEWNDVTGKYGVYQNDDEVVRIAGNLYNWYALDDPRNIAPEGWRVPTEEDWTILVSYLGGETVAGGKLKSTDFMHWTDPNTGATNSSGFTAVGGGVAHVNVLGANLAVQGIYWSSSDVNETTGLIRIMEHNHTQAIYSGANKKNGYSVRLIKTEEDEDDINYTVELSTSSPNEGTVTGAGAFKRGQRVTITALPKTGFAFHSWQITGSNEIFSNEANHYFYVGEDLSLTAIFKKAEEKFLISISEQTEIETIPNYGVYMPKDKLFMVTRYIGDDFINNGISKDHSGIVNDNGYISMVLNTKELESRGMYKPITGGGPHMWVFKHFSRVFPWSKSENYLSLSVKASVSYVELTDPKGNVATHNFTSEQAPVTQLSFGLYFTDKTNNVVFAITVPMYESRGTFQETANQHDTSTSFAISPLDSKSGYVTKAPLSSPLQFVPFHDLKYFEVHITRQNLERIIRDTKESLSSDITNYELTMAGIMFELPNYVENGHNISMANISELEVKIVGIQN